MERKGLRDSAETFRQNRLAKEGLKKKGWESTGDLPYSIAHEIGGPIAANTLAHGLASSLLKNILASQDEGYTAANVKKIGGSTFLSPELRQKIKEKAEEHYRDKKSHFGKGDL